MRNIIKYSIIGASISGLYHTVKESVATSINGISESVEEGTQIFQKKKEDSTRTRRNDDFYFQYKDPLNKFPLPQWLDEFLNSQPSKTHNETIS